MAPLETTRARLASLALPMGTLQAACAQGPVWWHGIKVVDKRFIEVMKRRGLHTHVWTVNEASEMHRLLDLGVDGLMTDRPALLKSVLISRGQWHQSV
jgi:glycerophosphoryl diester phosphodiesterase